MSHDHGPESAWISGKPSWLMIRFACGCAVAAQGRSQLFEAVIARAPKRHCGGWRPGDNPDRYHGGICGLSKGERVSASRRPTSVGN